MGGRWPPRRHRRPPLGRDLRRLRLSAALLADPCARRRRACEKRTYAGADFRLVVIGFNPRATADDGKRMVGGQIGFDTPVGRATTALIASAPVVARLTAAVGYHYAYDAERGRYAHPVALLVVTANGRLSRVLSGPAISGGDVRLALVEAGRDIGAIVDQVRLLCYGFSASVGFYTNLVRILLAAGGIATVLAIAVGFIALLRQTPARRA